MNFEPIRCQELPYIDAKAIQERTVVVLPFWDGSEWHMWIPQGELLYPLRCGSPILMDYVARDAEKSTDLFIPFVDYLWRHASFAHAIGRLIRIENDVHNLGTSFAKFEHFFSFRKEIGDGVVNFVATELEYLFTVARSIADLCHDLIRDIWNREIKLLGAKKKQSLPDSLSKFIFKNSADELIKKYTLPASLAEAYVKVSEILAPIRDARDEIVHHGAEVPTIFMTERGICVNINSKPFCMFKVWNDEHRFNEHIHSIMPLVAHLVMAGISIGQFLTSGLAREIRLLPDLAPGFRVFVRGFHNQSVIRLKHPLI